MHWADVVAQALAHKGEKHIIAAGITPSGEFHIGHLREILSGDMITRACKNAGLDAEFVFIAEENRWYLTSYGHLDIRAGLSHHAELRSE